MYVYMVILKKTRECFGERSFKEIPILEESILLQEDPLNSLQNRARVLEIVSG